MTKLQTKSALSAATDKAQDQSPLPMELKSSSNTTALNDKCTQAVQGSDISDSIRIKALSDHINQLSCSLAAVESVSTSALEHFRGMLCQILLAMENPGFYRDPESLALVLEALLEKAEESRLFIIGATESLIKKPEIEQQAWYRRASAANLAASSAATKGV